MSTGRSTLDQPATTHANLEANTSNQSVPPNPQVNAAHIRNMSGCRTHFTPSCVTGDRSGGLAFQRFGIGGSFGLPVVGVSEYFRREGSIMIPLTRIQTIVADAPRFGHMDGFGWGMMGMAWLAMLVLAGLVVWAVVYSSSRASSPSEGSTASAERILADGFARGDIDIDEYRDRLEEMRR